VEVGSTDAIKEIREYNPAVKLNVVTRITWAGKLSDVTVIFTVLYVYVSTIV
jgi:hypothetical protein